MSISTNLVVEIIEFTIAFGYLRSTTISGAMPLSTKVGFHMQTRSLPEQIMTESPNLFAEIPLDM